MLNSAFALQGRSCWILSCLIGAFISLLPGLPQAQEIEARTYSNAPVGINFISAGVAQAKAGNYTLTSEVMGLTHIFDAGGQSGKITLVLPYGQLSGSSSIGGRTVNASTEGLSDPLIKAAINLYGAPALTLDQFKSYQQDLIVGVSLAASVPWGKYNDNQLINVGANRWFIQPGLGVSKALGPWRLELAGAGIFYTSNTDFMGGNSLSKPSLFNSDSRNLLLSEYGLDLCRCNLLHWWAILSKRKSD